MERFRHTSAQRPVTLREVAEAAGVSSSAASVVLNGARSGTRVSNSTQRAVMEVATRMGYHPHKLAQSLATGRTGRIGFYSGRSRLDCRNPFFAEILAGVFDGAEGFGLDTVVHTSGHDRARIVDLVRSHALDGLVLHANPGDPIIPLLGDLLVPAVAVGDPIDSLPSVVVDDREGGALLAQHLGSTGHRAVLVKQSSDPPRSAIARIASFRETCERLGIVTIAGDEADGGGNLTAEDLRALNEGAERATAIMSWSDATAQMMCRSLEDVGLAIPGQVAVVGFDGFVQRFAPRYDLTTIRAPWHAVGQEAVRHLDTLIAGETVPLLTVFPVSFHHGDTT